MFDKSAHLYDLAYSFKDYASESEWVRNAIHARVPQARSLLDVACGTGKHLEHLRGEFDCQGLDLNPEFVELAQQRTGVRVHGASMDSFELANDLMPSCVSSPPSATQAICLAPLVRWLAI